MTLIYLDCETLGLDPLIHDIWEVAWAIEDDEVRSGFLSHNDLDADPMALEVNGYAERFGDRNPMTVDPLPEGELRRLFEFYADLKAPGLTVVGANPNFDLQRLSLRWGGATPWHYRAIDVESMAMGVFDYILPPSLWDLSNMMVGLGFDIPLPDHTSAGDVECVRAVYQSLVEMRDVMKQT